MDRKKKERYLLAVYLVVLFLSIILVFIGVKLSEGDARDIILNISTELIAVVLIFFIINKVFLVDQWNAEEKIEDLKKSIEDSKKTKAIDFFEEKINLSEFHKKSSKIELCGVTLSSDVNENFTLFREKILNGVDVKFMLIDPTSHAPKISSLRSEDEGNDKYYKRKLDVVFGDFEYLIRSIHDSKTKDQKIGNIEIRLLPYPPSFAINRFTSQSGEKSIVIELFTHKVGYESPPMFSLNSTKDKKWFIHFSQQYDAMWDKAKQWQSEVEHV
jgi:hypothetical protein